MEITTVQEKDQEVGSVTLSVCMKQCSHSEAKIKDQDKTIRRQAVERLELQERVWHLEQELKVTQRALQLAVAAHWSVYDTENVPAPSHLPNDTHWLLQE